MISYSEQIKHLYNRAGFGLTYLEYKKHLVEKKPISDHVNMLIRKANEAFTVPKTDFKNLTKKQISKLSGVKKDSYRKQKRSELRKLNTDWVNRMCTSRQPLKEKMAFFWHDHFACKIANPDSGTKYMNILYTHGTTSFRKLVHAISKDEEMMTYLNLDKNIKGSPNENFARELMELFTLGIGNYSEKDIQEATKSFTGWKTNTDGSFYVNKKQRDNGSINFLGKKGVLSGEEVIEHILSKKQTAIYIAGKIYKYFVNSKGHKGRIKKLGNKFYKENYNIKKLLNRLFKSKWFYKEENLNNMIKSPVDLIVSISKLSDITYTVHKKILSYQENLGHKLLSPPNVSGWVHDTEWINTHSLLDRIKMPIPIINTNKKNINPALKKNVKKLTNTEIAKEFFKYWNRSNYDSEFEEIESALNAKNEFDTIPLENALILTFIGLTGTLEFQLH